MDEKIKGGQEMSCVKQPLVSVLTPVYNGADHLAECIESVLAQAYTNWDYTIVNNCSTDESLAIAQKYAARDPRIRIVNNDRFLRILENHNETIRQISPESKYCKFVFADDWLYPSCIEEMVGVAEQHPSIGLVGAYTMDGRAVCWHGPPHPARCITGREVCRDRLLGGEYVFGTMTSLLVRSDLVRKRAAFFNELNLQADLEACFDVLQESDFGFVHQVLSFSRPPEQSAGSFASNFNTPRLADFTIFLKYAPALLNQTEYRRRWKEVGKQYYRVLAHNVLRIRPKQFWKYHQELLETYGCRIDPWLLMSSVVAEVASQLSHPLNAFRYGRRWWSSKVRQADSKRAENYRVPIRKEVT
ncbi:MAG: glycosyltransferase family 2 protein, partial [Acidobacteriia bacterium]|nr:glycosyltransferase family 2 protein [Terriglobia bacterium]